MSVKSFARKKILIGCRDVRFCRLKRDEASGIEYSPDVYCAPGVVEIGITWKYREGSAAADDAPVWEAVNQVESAEVTINMVSLSLARQAYLLGRKYDMAGGVVVTSDSDRPPWVAMGFKTARSDGTDDYCWLFKGRFHAAEGTYRAKEGGSVTFQEDKAVGLFIPTEYAGDLQHRVSQGDKTLGAGALAAYLDDVPAILAAYVEGRVLYLVEHGRASVVISGVKIAANAIGVRRNGGKWEV